MEYRLLLQTRCSSCHQINSVKALQETTSSDQWPSIILSTSTTRLLTKAATGPLCQLSLIPLYLSFMTVSFTKIQTSQNISDYLFPSFHVVLSNTTITSSLMAVFQVNWISQLPSAFFLQLLQIKISGNNWKRFCGLHAFPDTQQIL